MLTNLLTWNSFTKKSNTINEIKEVNEALCKSIAKLQDMLNDDDERKLEIKIEGVNPKPKKLISLRRI